MELHRENIKGQDKTRATEENIRPKSEERKSTPHKEKSQATTPKKAGEKREKKILNTCKYIYVEKEKTGRGGNLWIILYLRGDPLF